MTQAIPTAGASPVVIVSINYGDGWAQLFDNHALGWLVDEAAAVAPVPVVIGSMPPAAGDAASPQWGQFIAPYLLVPDVSRKNFYDFLTWLATGDGSSEPRKIGSGLTLDTALINGYQQWASANPGWAFDGEPPSPPARSGKKKDDEPARRR
jgi:hypothetical protein